MDEVERAKRDMTVVYGGRTFAVRAYRDRGAWHGIVIENRTPLHTGLHSAADAASCLAAAVGFVAAVVDGGIDATGYQP